MSESAWKKLAIAAVDVETTGFDAERDRIIEIGIVEMLDGEIIDAYGQLVNPGMPIPKAVRELTGIQEEDVRGAPPFDEIAATVAARLEGRIVVAYNLSFDRGFIAAELERCGRTWPDGPTLDPLVFARALLPWMKNKKLGQVAAELGVDLREAHRAKDDAAAAGEILFAFGDRLPEDLDQLLELQRVWIRQQEESMAIRRGRGLNFGAYDADQDLDISLGPAYIYGEEVDPYRALIRALPDARTKVSPV